MSFSALSMVTSLARSFITTLPSSLTTLRPALHHHYYIIAVLLNIELNTTKAWIVCVCVESKYRNGIPAVQIPIPGSWIWNGKCHILNTCRHTHHTSHITHHTIHPSHITHHTLHITHHTSSPGGELVKPELSQLLTGFILVH